VNILQQIVVRIRGRECEKLVKRTGSEIVLSGPTIVEGGLSISIGNFSNKIKELVNVPDVAVALDDSQYHLCIAISDMKDDEQLKNKYIAIRLQLVMAFNQLRAILGSIKEEPTEELRKQLVKWLRYMNDLHKHSISLLDPETAVSGKSGMTIEEIRKYQGINEFQLQVAVDQIKSNS
jgi:hypothetical protein